MRRANAPSKAKSIISLSDDGIVDFESSQKYTFEASKGKRKKVNLKDIQKKKRSISSSDDDFETTSTNELENYSTPLQNVILPPPLSNEDCS